MPNHVSITYQVEPAGASVADIIGKMNAAAVPVPPDILQAAGLRVVSDLTPAANPVQRNIDIVFGPSAAATAAATLDNNDRVDNVSVLTPGIDYVLPPRVDFVPSPPEAIVGALDASQAGTRARGSVSPFAPRIAVATAFLNLQDTTLVDGGGGYSSSTFAVVLGAMAPPTYGILPVPPPDWQAARDMPPTTGVFPPSCVQAVRVAVKGKGYTSQARVQFLGGLDPRDPTAREAQAKVTLGPRGRIVSVQVTDPGQGYVKVPQVIVVDPGQKNGGMMIVQPNPITGAEVNPTTTSSQFVAANLSPVMGQGTPATVKLTIMAGSITAVTVMGNGARYTQLPQILVIDPTGSGTGGIITPRMGVGSIELKTGGKGFKSAPSIMLTPFFKTLFPDSSNQAAPFFQLMQTAIAVSVISPVTSFAPVLT
jgi:hypothetical protein